ncbi:MAG: beta-carotene 15,15'-monooxygenase [Thermodesulfatator sp.]|nr:MAG: beta-carotene 15,15'-monooxygenase [Thermodesulfatator sp.]
MKPFPYNPDLVHFAVTVVFSFLLGLEVKTYGQQIEEEESPHFIGSARTYTFLGILGFIFFRLDAHCLIYIAGLLGFTGVFMLYYYKKLQDQKTSILLYLLGLVVYSMGPLSVQYTLWMPALLFVLTVFILNARKAIHEISISINASELETLGKMILLSAVILPLLPNKNVIPMVPLSPFKIWLAVVVVSGISYGGYIAQKYFFGDRQYLLTGLVGGLYSSTAVTVVLSKKAKELGSAPLITAAIIAATAMMYFRLIILTALFNLLIAKTLLVPLGILGIACLALSLVYARNGKGRNSKLQMEDKNPLELGTALVFAVLFVSMIVLTQFITSHYGSWGLNALSFVVGFADIDPFVLSLLTGKYSVGFDQVATAIVIATGSNNILKGMYCMWFGGIRNGRYPAWWLFFFGGVTIGIAFIL